MKKNVFVCLFAVLFCLILPLPASANSAEPPCFTVVVQNPPADLTLTVEFDSGLSLDPVELRRESKVWEVYYRFNYYDVSFDYDNGQSFWSYGPEGLTGAQLVIDTGWETFSLPIDPTGFSKYNNLLTLNLSSRTLSVGQPWWRVPLLVFLRVALTLLLEGLLFFLFGYREHRSWLVFLLVNLITQLGVNLVILFLAPAATTSLSIWMGFFLYTPHGDPGIAGGDVRLFQTASGTHQAPGCPVRRCGECLQLGFGRVPAGCPAFMIPIKKSTLFQI